MQSRHSSKNSVQVGVQFVGYAFQALTVLVGQREGHLASKGPTLAIRRCSPLKAFGEPNLALSSVWKNWSVKRLNFPFSALTLLFGRQEGHPSCKKLDVGLLVMI